MTNREAPSPAPADIPAGETAATPEELEHLVKGLDFSGVVDYARTLDIPGFEQYDNMVGSRPITIDGLPATVGWIGHRPGANTSYKSNETPPIEVANPGGEDVVVVEGHLHAVIATQRTTYPTSDWAIGRSGRPGFLQFNNGDTVFLSVAHGQHERSWYVCFYPEAPEPIEPQSTG